MKTITLAQAQTVVSGALAFAREKKFKPLGVAVLDVRGALVAYAAEDGATLGRAHVATGKASGCIMMGLGSRSIAKRGRGQVSPAPRAAHRHPAGQLPARDPG